MVTSRIIRFHSCAMLALVPFATSSAARPTSNQESRQNLRLVRCLCSSRPSKRLRPMASVSTRSSFSSTMGMSWEFIRGSFCGIGVRAGSVKRLGPSRRALITRNDCPDFSGRYNSWILPAPCDPFRTSRELPRSRYFCITFLWQTNADHMIKAAKFAYGLGCLIAVLGPLLAILLYPRAKWLFAFVLIAWPKTLLPMAWRMKLSDF